MSGYRPNTGVVQRGVNRMLQQYRSDLRVNLAAQDGVITSDSVTLTLKPALPATAPAAYYSFQTLGALLPDDSGNGRDLVNFGIPSVSGLVGSAGEFNGVSNFARGSVGSLLTGYGFSVSLWVLPIVTGSGVGNCAFMRIANDGTHRGCSVGYITAGSGLVKFYNVFEGPSSSLTSDIVPVDAWVNIQLVSPSTGTEATPGGLARINGGPWRSFPVDAAGSYADLAVGGSGDAVPGHDPQALFHGLIDELAFYPAALSDADFDLIYQAGLHNTALV